MRFRRRRSPEQRVSQPASALIRPRVAPPSGTLRIALTLPGGVSFGTVEAGAVCALVVAVQQMNRKRPGSACVDIIAGSSSGALSGVLAAHTLVFGEDPVPVFQRAWVSEPSLRGLLGRGRTAPLSLRRARAVADDLLAGRSPADVAPRQTSDITLIATLGCLRGFGYRIRGSVGPVSPRAPAEGSGIYAAKASALEATSYLDWAQHTLHATPIASEPDAEQVEQWTHAVDAAMASAAHPAVFPPERLDRNRKDYDVNQVHGLPDVDKGGRTPDKVRLWYTDGGLVDNQPLGHCLNLVTSRDTRSLTEAAESDPLRRVLLVRSGVDRPPGPTDPAWAGRTRPRWTETLQRALGLLAAHNVGEDLRHVEKVNTRIRRSADLAQRLDELVKRQPDDLRNELRAELVRFLMSVDDERNNLPRHDQQLGLHQPPDPYAPRDEASLREVVHSALLAASGLHDKRWVDVNVVEPRSEIAQAGGHRLLEFGGFLDRRRREYDFAAGYWSMVKWIEDPASGLPVSAEVVSAVKMLVRKPRTSGERAWRSRRLRLSTRLLLARLGARVAIISLRDAVAVNRRKKLMRSE